MDVQTVILADPHHKTIMVASRSKLLDGISGPRIVDIEVLNVGLLQIEAASCVIRRTYNGIGETVPRNRASKGL